MSIPGYQLQRTATGAPYVDLSATAVPVQWRLYERHTNALTMTAQDIIEDARLRHWSFADVQLGDGAAVRWLNTRQRFLLLKFREGLKGVVTLTVRTKAVMPSPGRRIGVTPRGTPYELEDEGDGYAVYLAPASRAPYIDLSGVPIADAPLDDGFPLPVEVISVTALKGVYVDGQTIPVTVTMEQQRSVSLSGRQLTAFASGSRIAPLRNPGAPLASQSWESITAVEVSYIAMARITALCCLLSFPSVLVEALTAGMAKFFATQSKLCTPDERRDFFEAARTAEEQLESASNDILGEAPTRSVIFKG